MFKKRPWLVPVLLLLLGGLAVASAIVQIGSMASGSSPVYVEHIFVSGLHLLPGITLMLLGPLQFVRAIRRRWPAVHRWMGRAFVISGLVVAFTALWMNEFFPAFGGFLKYSVVFTFSVGLIVTLCLAVFFVLRRDFTRHRAWMMRAVAIGLGGATQRVYILPLFVILGELNDVMIGVGMWLGFGVLKPCPARDGMRRPHSRRASGVNHCPMEKNAL